MPRQTRKYEDFLDEQLKDPKEAVAYLNAAFEDYNQIKEFAPLLLALQDVAKAHGMSKLATKTGRSRTSLYKSFSEHGEPLFSTVLEVMDALSIQFGKLQLEFNKAANE